MDTNINIRMAANGVILRYSDPEIEAKNREGDSKYEDSDVELVFKDAKEAMPEVQRVLQMLMGEDRADEAEFNSAFEEATDE
jgi:hypothetical protein